MITYSLNWMGPINSQWIQKHGNQWSAGRIDIDGTKDSHVEIGVSPMHSDDWGRFGKWLRDLETKEVWSLQELIKEYEKTNPKILWLYGEPI